MLNSEEIIAAIHGSYATGSKNGFQNVLTLLDKMHVALRTPIVHVAGTNGKGSTCAMLESVLRRAGYHTGLYTSPFLQAYQGKRHEYDNLLTYFMYRHFMKALGDDAVQDKVQLALVSTAVIQLLDVYEWLAKGEVTHWAQICICKAYSREIEYNEDNTEQLAAFSVLDEME